MRIFTFCAVALAATSPVFAQTLDEILAPRPDTAACWHRTYSDAHLAKHPQQKVTAVDFYLDYYEMDHDEAGKGSYSFSIDFTTRERKGGAGGLCQQGAQGKVTCGGDCDSGALTIRNSGTKGSLLVELLSGGMTLTDCEEDAPYYMSAEPDDKVFLVHPVACPAD
ncbi:hypothetical protein [Vannielia sp.]|uniref:hypothetical protein n=1 Tax=Vannielia sp. TaxID=2813045 RepID=UPI00260455E3|nr:hypothetical protein [Vannielia sp.]MDF1871318.1 hypothetical protein [Vannielia sp.]